MQEEQTVLVFADGLHGIATAHLVVRDVELELHVTRICRVEDPPHLVGTLADRVHVIVIAERDSKIECSLADLRQHPSKSLVVVAREFAFRARIRRLQIQPADVPHELRVPGVELELLLLERRVDAHAAAR